MEMITQNNILIAEFMGFKKDSPSTNWYYDLKKSRYYRLNELLYDTDWNWLMKVVDKIESLGYVHSIYGNFSTFLKKGTFNELIWVDEFRGNTKLEAVYISVIEFIKWYNETKQK
jgi:hypothetical protein